MAAGGHPSDGFADGAADFGTGHCSEVGARVHVVTTGECADQQDGRKEVSNLLHDSIVLVDVLVERRCKVITKKAKTLTFLPKLLG